VSGVQTCFYVRCLTNSAKCDQVGLPVILSVCVQLHAKGYAWIYTQILSEAGLGTTSRLSHFGGDPDRPSLSFRGHSRPGMSLWDKIYCSAETVTDTPKLL